MPGRPGDTIPTPVLQFPGQSSFAADAVDRALDLSPGLAPLVAQAERAVGRSLRALSRTNRDVQVGVFVANHLHALALAEAGVHARRSIGLSLGEYNHLVHVGAIDFLDALALVDARGAAYDDGPAGCMAAIFPLPLEELEPLLAGTSAAVANFNSDTQHVVAGSHADVAEVCRRVEQETLAEHRVIEPNLPMHHPMFAPVAERFGPRLRAAPWRTPAGPYVPNVLGGPAQAPTPASIAELLTRHVSEPVWWRRSVDHVLCEVPDAALVEVGPGTVLHDLCKRWVTCARLHTADRAALRATARAITGEVADGR